MIRSIWRGLRPYTHGQRWVVGGIGGVSVLAGVSEAAALLLAVRVALNLSTGGDGSIDLPVVDAHLGVGPVLGVAVLFGLLALVCHGVLADLSARLASSTLAQARAYTVARYVEAGWSTQALQREGALQETATSLSIRTANLAQQLTLLGANLVSIAMFAMTAFFVDAITTMGVLLVGIGIVAILRPIALKTRRAGRAFVGANSRYAEDVSRLTGTSMELKVFGVQRAAEAELARSGVQVQRLQHISIFWTQLGSALYRDLAVLLLIGAVAVLSLANDDKVAGIGVVVVLMVRALASAQAANSSYQTLVEGGSNLEALQKRVATLASGAQVHGDKAVPKSAAIELRDVGYSYTPGISALEGISFELAVGDALGVIGPSGGGKSTLIQVLLRLRPPTSGQVLVDGMDYRVLDDDEWASFVGFVPQEPTLLEGSVADNISYYRNISRAAVEQAARDANVYVDVMRLPNGFDTLLGPRGSGLSGGQKQRVAIARALAGRPQLLVLDEPSSALDGRSEDLLRQTLARLKGNTTLVIIAHRLGTVDSCDRLLLLEEGRVQQLDDAATVLRGLASAPAGSDDVRLY